MWLSEIFGKSVNNTIDHIRSQVCKVYDMGHAVEYTHTPTYNSYYPSAHILNAHNLNPSIVNAHILKVHNLNDLFFSLRFLLPIMDKF